MTGNQIAYANLVESNRHNVVTESETNRHNVVSENETARHNYATEFETNRHNVITENETQRHNISTEELDWFNANEGARHNRASENLGWFNAKEGARHNKVSENIGIAQAVASSQQAQAALANASASAEQARVAGVNAQTRQDELSETRRNNTIRWLNESTTAEAAKTNAETNRIRVDSENRRRSAQTILDTVNTINSIYTGNLNALINAFGAVTRGAGIFMK